MRSYRTLIILAVVSVAVAVPFCTTLAKTPKVLIDAGTIAPALDVFPYNYGTTTPSKYDNIYSEEAAADLAEGSFTVLQESSGKYVTINVTVSGLIPFTAYRVYFDQNGITVNDIRTAGPCMLIGLLYTNAAGTAGWTYTSAPGDWAPGVYTWSIYINRIIYSGSKLVANHTVLISDNLNFEIQS